MALIAALGEHGIASEHSICVRREATESASRHLTIAVPVTARLDFWYPESPNTPIENGRKQVTFLPPTELLAGERIHQWIGARYSLASDTTDFDRLRRQQALLARLLETRWRFGVVLADPELVDISSAEAIDELKQVDAAWQMEILDDLIDATIDGKMVLLGRDRPRRLTQAFPILMYHRIGDPPPGFPWPGLYVTGEGFRLHLEEISSRGYTPVTQRDLHDGWAAARPLPGRPIVLSFDDGHKSIWEEAFPLLSAKEWPAVLNLDMSTLDGESGVSTEMVRTMLAAGWELAAHSRTHPDLTQLGDADLRSEVHGSRCDLADRFGAKIDFFCYPSGRYSPAVIDSVIAAGYLGATTTVPGLAEPEHPYEMSRVRVSREDDAVALGRRLEQLERETAGRATDSHG